MRDRETVCELAVAGMVHAITSLYERKEGRVRQYAGFFLSDAEVYGLEEEPGLEFSCFQQAVDEAEMFYQDEAGGSHDLSHLADCDVWQTLASLPAGKDENMAKFSFEVEVEVEVEFDSRIWETLSPLDKRVWLKEVEGAISDHARIVSVTRRGA